MASRRDFMMGVALLPLLAAGGVRAQGAKSGGAAIITMRGTPRGERVWFDPVGLWVDTGLAIRFRNEDAANVHSATAFHPDLYGKSRRIPQGMAAWDSGLLLPGEEFELVAQVPGVYDYYCLPHAAHGMVGRIVVGSPEDAGWKAEDYHRSTQAAGMPGVFPEVTAILAQRSHTSAQ